MTPYLLDTNLLLAYVAQKPAWQRTTSIVKRSPYTLSMSIVNESEIKAIADYRGRGIPKRLKLDQLISRCGVYPISGSKIVDAYVRLSVQCRRRGLKLSQNDTWIAATAILYKRHLLTSDKDFIPIAKEFVGFTWIEPN